MRLRQQSLHGKTWPDWAGHRRRRPAEKLVETRLVSLLEMVTVAKEKELTPAKHVCEMIGSCFLFYVA